MKIDVAAILKEPGESLPFDLKGTMDLPGDEGGTARAEGPFTVRGVATSLGDGVYVEANIRGTVVLTCSRCLSEFSRPVDLSCEGKFGGMVREERKSDDEDEVEIFELEGTFCDLTEMLRHEVVLSLPMKPLCDEACKGLCPECGKNLNEGECDCAATKAESTAFGRKLMEALEERGKKNGRS